MRRMFYVLGLALLIPAAAQAQFGLAGGISFPQGDLDDGVDSGWHLMGVFELAPAMLPVGLRIDGGYQDLPSEAEGAGAFDYQQIFVTGNAVLRMNTVGLAPYLLGGVGFYRDRLDLENSNLETDWENDFGVNVGVGLDLPLGGFNTFVETRLHHITGDNSRQTIPVTFGIKF